MKKVLITGITGLVGSAFAVDTLKRDKELSFVAITRKNREQCAADRVKDVIKEQCEFDGTPELAEDLLKRIDVVEGDVSDPLHLAMSKKLDGISAIFHCAADVNLGVDAEGRTFNVNFNGTKALLEIAVELKVDAFHYVSTAYVAGKTKGLVKEDEQPATDWHNSYERSKFESEKLVRASGIPFTIYRPSIIVGRRTDGKIRKPLAFYFILEFLAVLKERHCARRNLKTSEWLDMPLRLHAKVTDSIFFVPIDYVTQMATEIFFLPPEGKTYHLTGNTPVSTHDIEYAVANALKVRNVRIVDSISDMTPDERLIHRFLGEFLPYFGSEAIFDQSNIISAFGKEVLDWNLGDDALLHMIGSYYKDNFPELTDSV